MLVEDETRTTLSARAHPGYAKNLNFETLRYLVDRLPDAPAEESAAASSSTDKGKKRSASSGPEDAGRQAKRAKIESGDSDIEFVDDNEAIPVVRKRPNRPGHVLAYRHTFFLQYSLEGDRSDYQENGLPSLLPRKLTGAHPVSLGAVRLVQHGEHLICNENDYTSQLLVVPSIELDVDTSAYDYGSPIVNDLLQCIMLLKSLDRVELDASLRLIPRADSGAELPFTLELTMSVSLVTPAIFEPLPLVKSKRIMLEREDAQRYFLSRAYPTNLAVRDGPTNIPAFYSILDAAPAFPDSIDPEALQPEALLPTLLPFQRRSVAFLLNLERKTIDEHGRVVPTLTLKGPAPLPLFWDVIERGEGRPPMYRNLLTGELHDAIPPVDEADLGVGGILAEEPGLGKTLESIALILLNPPGPQREPSVTRWDPQAKLDVKEVKTTLIVTPPALASQWADELALHAPTLKVLIYDGWTKMDVPITATSSSTWQRNTFKPKSKKTKGKGKAKAENDEEEEEEVLEWARYVNQFDVCITTYSVLQSDFTVAHAPPVRPRRADVVYATPAERPRSPLVMVEFYRVIMDEVQMVGGGRTEGMVSLIPRLSSFAVSGTPARAQVADLLHVLNFLRVDNQIGPKRFWQRLLTPGHFDLFAQLFRRYSVRTIKSTVKKELTIPTQTRYLVPIHLGKVEKHVYENQLEMALMELGLDARGVAAIEGWEIDATLLRSALRKLRGLCTHPQVGNLVNPKKGDKAAKGGIKTMAEVLEGMKDLSWRTVMDERKAKIQLTITHAQLVQQDLREGKRYQVALDLLLAGEKDTQVLIDDLKLAVVAHEEKGKELKAEAKLALKRAEADKEKEKPDNGKGKGKERASSAILSEDEDEDGAEDEEDSDLPKTPAGKAHANKRSGLSNRLREAQVTLHRIKFLQGDMYHVLGATHAPQEDAAYAAADVIRKELLKVTEEAAVKSMVPLTAAKGVSEDTLLIETPYCGEGGEESEELMKCADNMIEKLLNAQSALIWTWRKKIHELLTGPLTIQGGDDDVDGQEYSRSLETQGEVEVYLQAYTMLLSDHREALTNERTILAQNRGKERKARKTKTSAEAEGAALMVQGAQVPEDIEFMPEHKNLHSELTAKRRKLLVKFNGKAIKTYMVELSKVAAGIDIDNEDEEAMAERATAREGADLLRNLIKTQNRLMDKFDVDLALFRRAFNDRIQYFRQLQEISDSVTEAVYEGTLADAIEALEAEKIAADVSITRKRAQQRYLTHLADNKDAEDEDEEDSTCIVCKCEFERGYISTQCAHAFCEECLELWMSRKEGKTCPICRTPMTADHLQPFKVGEQVPEAPAPPAPAPVAALGVVDVPVSRRKIDYNIIDPKLFESIQELDTHGSYGTKIQTLVQHLLYIQINDKGSKSIVFSAWADSLTIIAHAVRANGIPCLTIDQSRGQQNAAKVFRSDPKILVLLLHGERQNSGLNVTCASRVFMLESVVHHGFEIQAIARIDRMGQTNPTEVFCYFAEETIERNILDLAAKQGLSLYTKANSSGTVDQNAFDKDQKEIDSPAKRNAPKLARNKGDFIFSIDDMLAILFPHMYEDLEYLIPENDDVEMVDDTAVSREANPGAGDRTGGRPVQVNAVAGPSRSR